MITAIAAQLPVQVPNLNRPVTGKLEIDEYGEVTIKIENRQIAEYLLTLFNKYETTHLLSAGIFLEEAVPATIPGLEKK